MLEFKRMERSQSVDFGPDEAGWRAQCEAYFLEYAEVVECAARKVLGPRPACEDIIQDVFLRLLENRQPSPLSRRYFVVAGRNAALNHLRWERRRDERIRRLSFAPQPDSLSQLEKIMCNERKGEIAAAIETLPTRCRAVARRTWQSGWSASKIAKDLGMTVKRVERHRAVARRRLQELLLHDSSSRPVTP
jgi:RNA polymerase sigma factor (sigma-70 family)